MLSNVKLTIKDPGQASSVTSQDLSKEIESVRRQVGVGVTSEIEKLISGEGRLVGGGSLGRADMGVRKALSVI